MADGYARGVSKYFSEHTKPTLNRILVDAAAVSIRTLAGEDTTTAQLAVTASLASLAREEKSYVIAHGRQLAMDAAIALLKRALPLPLA